MCETEVTLSHFFFGKKNIVILVEGKVEEGETYGTCLKTSRLIRRGGSPWGTTQ